MKNLEEIVGILHNGKILDLHSIENLNNKEINVKNIIKNSAIGLEIIRHSCAHILAQAILNIYSGCEVFFATGPITENGFFYDCQIQNKNKEMITISSHDLSKIEREMLKIIDQNLEFKKKIIKKSDFYNETKDFLKKIVLENIPDNEISTYTQGDFTDLCRGPHVKNTNVISKSLKLIKVSEILWKDQKLQRIEGLYFNTQEDLELYEKNKELQIQNDHKRIGKQMDLFSFDEHSRGSVFFHSKGLFLVNQIKNIIRKIGFKKFNEVETPVLFRQELFEATGHLANYSEHMFLIDDCCLKPMNCPAHTILFSKKNLNFKELPYRVAEFGTCFRKEEHGALNGLKRCLRLTIDDGHIFCQAKHIKDEIVQFLKDANEIYSLFGLKDLKFRLATRPKKSIGTDEGWNLAESCLKEALKDEDYILAEGDGAFYGPKIEIHFKDNLGKYWQCGTIQVDFFLSERLNSYFLNENNEKEYPIILHRAILGSMERFLGIWLEQNKLPLYFTPDQAVILPISEKFNEYAQEVSQQLKDIRHFIDLNSETLNKKLKKSLESKIPICIIIGEKEQNDGTLTVRFNNENKVMTIEEFIQYFRILEKCS